jgi:hypothetical protein
VGVQIRPAFRQSDPSPPSRVGDKWHLDEVALKIAGVKHWLWRTVDQTGTVLDGLVQRRRDRQAAKRLLRKLLKKQMRPPRVMITDKLASYGAAKREIMPGIEHRQHRGRRRCRDSGHRRCYHQTADRQIRPEHLPRPLSGGASGADRGQDERSCDKPTEVSAPPPVIDLMAAVKRSLAQDAPTAKRRTANKAKRTKEVPDRSQPALLLRLSGGGKQTGKPRRRIFQRLRQGQNQAIQVNSEREVWE